MADEHTYDECLHDLVMYNAALQIAHWQADTITNEHKVLGDLYETMTGFTDTLAEIYMGKDQVIKFISDMVLEDVSIAPCAKGLEIIDELRQYCVQGEDDDMLNTIADMSAALNKAKYLLKEKHAVLKDSEEGE